MATFRKVKKTCRGRRLSPDSGDDSDDDNDVSATVEELKEVQKLRQRQHGVNAEDLAVGKVLKKETKDKSDPLKLKTGGYVDYKTLKKEIETTDDSETLEQIGTSFAAETNRRDEDTDMLKYVELELNRRKGIKEEEEEKKAKPRTAEDFLYELPEHIRAITSKTKKTEDMLSNQMLSGIPEVDLGIDAKIRNIEATEEAKSKLLDERKKKKDSGVSFVPTNMAVNFVQHNRFSNIDDHKPKRQKVEVPKPIPLRVGDVDRPSTMPEQKSKPNHNEKATDDFYYERFKKQVRKY